MNGRYIDHEGRIVMTDGGAATAPTVGGAGGGLNDTTAGIQKAEDMTAGSGFQAACNHSQYVMHASRGNERAALQAHKAWQAERVANSQLRKDEWLEIDDTVIGISQRMRVMVQDLINRGLVIPLDLGTLRWEWETVDDTGDAEVDMGAETGGDEDLPRFAMEGVPLPIVHKSFRLNMRKLRASRNRGDPLDTTAVTQATRSVNKKLEDIMANGIAGLTVEGDQVYGYTNHPDRNVVDENGGWSAGSADDIIDDALKTVEAIENDNRGDTDMVFYLGRGAFQTARAKNSGTDDKRGVLELIRDRLAGEDDFPGVTFRRADFLDDSEGVLVEMAQDTVQLAVPSDVQAIEWESQGGMVTHSKVMASQIPVLKSDQSGQMGLAHLINL